MPNSHAITASIIARSSGTATPKYEPRRRFTLRAFLSGVWLRHNDGSDGVGGKCHVVLDGLGHKSCFSQSDLQ